MARISTGGFTISNTPTPFPNSGISVVGGVGVSYNVDIPQSFTSLFGSVAAASNTVGPAPLLYGTSTLGVAYDYQVDGKAPRVNYVGMSAGFVPGGASDPKFTFEQGYLSLMNRESSVPDGFIPIDACVTFGAVGNSTVNTATQNTVVILGYNSNTGANELHVSPPYSISYSGINANGALSGAVIDSIKYNVNIFPSPIVGELYIVRASSSYPLSIMYAYTGISSNNIGSSNWLRPGTGYTIPVDQSTHVAGFVDMITDEYDGTGTDLWMTMFPSTGTFQGANAHILAYAKYDFANNKLSTFSTVSIPNTANATSFASAVYNAGTRRSIAMMRTPNPSFPTVVPGYVITKPYGSNNTYGTWSSPVALPALANTSKHYWDKLVTVSTVPGYTPQNANVVIAVSKSNDPATNSAIFARSVDGGQTWASVAVGNTTTALYWSDVVYHAPTDEFVAIAGNFSTSFYTCTANTTATWTRRDGLLPSSGPWWSRVFSHTSRPSDGFIDRPANTANISSVAIGANATTSSVLLIPSNQGGVMTLPTPNTAWNRGVSHLPTSYNIFSVQSNKPMASMPGTGFFHLVYDTSGKVGVIYSENPANGLWRNQLLPQTFLGMTEKLAANLVSSISANTVGYQSGVGTISATRPWDTTSTTDTIVTRCKVVPGSEVSISNYYLGTAVSDQGKPLAQDTLGDIVDTTEAVGFTKPVGGGGWFVTVGKSTGDMIRWCATVDANVGISTTTNLARVSASSNNQIVGVAVPAEAPYPVVILRADGLVEVDTAHPNQYIQSIVNQNPIQLYADTWKSVVWNDGVFTAIGDTYIATSSSGDKWDIRLHYQANLYPSTAVSTAVIGQSIVPFNLTTNAYPTTSKSITPASRPDGFGPYGTTASPIDSRIWVAGRNNLGQLGDGTTIEKSSPVQTIAGGANWVSVAGTGRTHAGIKADGTLWLWGSGDFGITGDGSPTNRSSPIQTISKGYNWRSVDLARDHAAAIKTDGTLWLWGRNEYGELGDNTTSTRLSPVQIVSGGTWSSVSVATLATAAIKTDGTLWTWGSTVGQGLASSPIQVTGGGTTWKQISLADGWATAIKTDGTLWVWGNNTYGQLGTNSTTYESSPTQTVAGGTNWKQVSAHGSYRAAAVKTDGTLWVWGYNDSGYLGDGSFVSKSSPVQTIAKGTNWKQVATGSSFFAAVKTDGTLWAWGSNSNGQHGDGTTTSKTSPQQNVAAGAGWAEVAVGFETTIALRAGTMTNDAKGWWNTSNPLGFNPNEEFIPVTEFEQYYSYPLSNECRLWAWGANDRGAAGDNTITHRSSPVQTVAGGTNWRRVEGGLHSTLAIKSDGTLWNWGLNSDGQLADNTVVNKSSPIQTIAAGNDWKRASSSGWASAAIKGDGTLWCWGYNFFGGIGDGTVARKSSPVQTIAGGTDWKQVSCSGGSTAAIKTNGTLWIWGYNAYGQLGDNTITHKSSPIQTVAGGTNWMVVSMSEYNTAAIKTDGTLWTWGYNTNGALGDGTTINRSSPNQTIAGGNNWKQVSSGSSIAAIKTDGTLWTWGWNAFGQLGDNTTISRSSPVQTITGGTNWKQVSTISGTTGAVKIDGTMWMWGANNLGQLGDNTITNRSSPVQTVAGGTNWRQVSLGSSGTTFALEYVK